MGGKGSGENKIPIPLFYSRLFFGGKYVPWRSAFIVSHSLSCSFKTSPFYGILRSTSLFTQAYKKTAPEKIRVQIPPHETKDLWQHQSEGDLIKKMAQSEQWNEAPTQNEPDSPRPTCCLPRAGFGVAPPPPLSWAEAPLGAKKPTCLGRKGV